MAIGTTMSTSTKRATSVAVSPRSRVTMTTTTIGINPTFCIYGLNAQGDLLNWSTPTAVCMWMDSYILLGRGQFVLENQPELTLGMSGVLRGENDLVCKYEESLHADADQVDTPYTELIQTIMDDHLRVASIDEEHHALLKTAWSTELGRLLHAELEEHNAREAQKEEKKNK
ncbi:hypothetical protein LTR27_012102 [Elasticomyces elasticus]|nr:hypothetical protein LTR27_012102 [Elasticomyces elasticus]